MAAAQARLAAAERDGESLFALAQVGAAAIAAARQALCANLGWRLPGRVGGALRPVKVSQLAVAMATRLQRLSAHDAIAERHVAFLTNISTLDGLQQSTLQLAVVHQTLLPQPGCLVQPARPSSPSSLS